ncbi:hypothetical protein D3C80_1257930 [compost metagenome]
MLLLVGQASAGNQIKQRTAAGGKIKTALAAFFNPDLVIRPTARHHQVIAAATKALAAKIVWHTAGRNRLQPRFDILTVGNMTQHQGESIAF